MQQRATKTIKSMEHLSWEGTLGDMFSLEWKSLRQESQRVSKGRVQGRWDQAIPSDKTRSNVHKTKNKRSLLNNRRNFFTERVTGHWHRLPRKVVENPSLEI